MTKRLYRSALVIMFALSGGMVEAQNTQQIDDATCFRIAVASNAQLAQNPNNPMALMAMYYLGRLENSGAQLEPILKKLEGDKDAANPVTIQNKGRICLSSWQASVMKSKAAFKAATPAVAVQSPNK